MPTMWPQPRRWSSSWNGRHMGEGVCRTKAAWKWPVVTGAYAFGPVTTLWRTVVLGSERPALWRETDTDCQ